MPPRKAGATRGRPPAQALPVPIAYPGKKADGGGMDEAEWTACRDMLEQVYRTKEGTRKMCGIFRELPDRDEWADYYEAIPEPECLDNICTRLGDQGFNSPEEFFKQLHLVFLNAMHYNEEGSQVWNDAKKYEDKIHDAWRAQHADGTFAHEDPHHKGGRGRKPKTAAAASPAAVAAPSVVLRVPIPDAVKQETAAPSDPPTRSRETRGNTRTASSPVKVMPPRGAKAEVGPAPPISGWSLAEADARVVSATDEKLPKWEGPRSLLPGDPAPGGILGSGWWGEGAPEYERRVGGQASWKGRIRVVADAIEAYKDPQGVRLSEAFAQMPAAAEIPYLSSSQNILPWASIHQRARNQQYSTLHDFDKDMSRLFEKARRWFQGRAEGYGRIITLQRLYNALTAPYPFQISPSGVPPSPTKFASLPAGPGVARWAHDPEALRPGANQEGIYGITASRIPFKDRQFTEEARHKGIAYRVGDFVHLINPSDASRPIVGQVFKTFVPTTGFSTHHVTVCWYFRPEQTVHPVEKTFYENEVFKTTHFCDHPVEDIIERITVQPTESASRGRPVTPAFFPGWPLYVCNTRYIDKACLFMRIKKWANVLPESLRGTDPTVVTPFERSINLPQVKSPFSLGVKGPGSVGGPRRQPMAADSEEEEAAAAVIPSQSRRASGPQVADGRTRQAIQTPPTQQRHAAQPPANAASSAGPSRTPQAASSHASPAPQQQRTGAAQNPAWRASQASAQAPLFPKRTFAAVMGGAQVLEQVAVREYLPPDTTKLFEQDARHQVLWFSGPPLAPGSVKMPAPPNHSLEYLTFLSKRKSGSSVVDARPGKLPRTAVKEEEDEDAEGEDEDADEDELSGDISRHWWAQGQTEEQLIDSLRAVAGV